MGPERLSWLGRWIARAALAGALGALLVGCGGGGRSSPRAAASALPGPRHVQIVRAMTTPERRALVARFRERNPGERGRTWAVNDDALGPSVMVVDPFARFLRRARLERVAATGAPRSASSSPGVDADKAADVARAFVRRNADLFGIPHAVSAGLAERVREAEPGDHASPRAIWAVRLDAPFPTKGYEAFRELDNVADVEVFIDDDGEPSSFVNLSRVHPRLALDTAPLLARDDPRLLARLLDRTVFAVVDDGRADLGSRRELEQLRRIPLGKLRADEVRRIELVVHVSTGPELAWTTYRLAYFIEVAKVREPPADDPLGGAPQVFFFRYVVDADTGDVLEDARVPVTQSSLLLP